MSTARKFMTALLLSILPVAVHSAGGEVDHGEPAEDLTEKHRGGRAPVTS